MKTGDKVVCIKEFTEKSILGDPFVPYKSKTVVVGGIYTVREIYEVHAETYYKLVETNDGVFRAANFRPVDDTFGPCVCEILEKQIEHDKVLA